MCYIMQRLPETYIPLCHFSYLRQMLTDFENFSAVTYCGQLAVK